MAQDIILDNSTVHITVDNTVTAQSNDGGLVTLGAKTDTKATDGSTTSWSVVALLKGTFDWLLTKMPASLGQKTMANSLAITLASDQSNLPVVQVNGPNRITNTLNTGVSATVWPVATIPVGHTVTGVEIYNSVTFNSANLTFNGSFDNTNFEPVYKDDGTIYTITVGALSTTGRNFFINPTYFLSYKYVQIVATASQPNSTVVYLITKPV